MRQLLQRLWDWWNPQIMPDQYLRVIQSMGEETDDYAVQQRLQMLTQRRWRRAKICRELEALCRLGLLKGRYSYTGTSMLFIGEHARIPLLYVSLTELGTNFLKDCNETRYEIVTRERE